jgi:hypothetical protein
MGLWFGRFEWMRTLQLIDKMLKVEKKYLDGFDKKWYYFILCQRTIEG